ncbi:YicC family protein [Flavobacteriaceae bacterium]|nr:YicC family protein [Flavobacteriaceae bacterium]MDC1540625.1 YicC family protein [Flavobacteriaceae bacterium]
MIHSMTGYGKSVLQLPNKTISIEIKSLNSKSLDLNMRMPSMYRSKELGLRKLIASKLNRGKVDFSLFFESTGEATHANVNPTVVNKYIKQLEGLVIGNKMDFLQMAIKMPDAISTEREDIDESEWADIQNEILNALENIRVYRMEEGNVLELDFTKRISLISNLLEQVLEIDPERITNVRERLHKGVSELKEKYDENRFEQELVYYIEKFDITEEKVRLQNHLEYFIKTLNSDDSNGKKLGFISQEIGREINTIGSKANFAPMQKLVVQMKDELEKIKEQLLNVL